MAYPLDISGTPYYDTGADEISRGYILVLPVPGRKIQGREFLSAQRLLEKGIKDVGDMIAKDGTLIEGGELVVKRLSETSISVQVGAGKVYINGRIWDVPALSATTFSPIPANLTIDVDIVEVVIDENSDSNLRSPAENYSNYNQPGAHRLKATASFQLNSTTGVTVHRLVDGSPLKLQTSSAFSELEPILARRTYDESDNYLVTGLSIISEGDDETAFASQDYVIPTGVNPFPEGTVTWGTTASPYGPAWSNRFVANSGSPAFTSNDVGRRLILLTTGTNTTHPFAGAYDIVDVISSTEVELDAQFSKVSPASGSEINIAYGIKEAPQNIKITVNAGKAYVLGFEVLKPISSRLSINKALTGREIINEPHTTVFRTFNYAFREQPFSKFASEGVTANLLIGLGMPAEMSGTARSETGPSRTGAEDDLFTITGYPIVRIVAAAPLASSWSWDLDRNSGSYPGAFSGTFYPESAVNGWTQNGNKIKWNGTSSVPSIGTPYRVVCVLSVPLVRGEDYRIRNTGNAIMYQLPGATTAPNTSNSLFFPQSTYNLTAEPQFVFDVDGTRVLIDFADPSNAGANLVTPSIAAVPIQNVVNVINKAGNTAGLPNIATVQFESKYTTLPTRGYIVLRSPTSGTSSYIEIIQGNTILGFPTDYIVTGSADAEDVIAFGGHRALSRIDKNNALVQVDYEFGLYRKDLVTLDRDGNLAVLQGTPEIPEKVSVRDGFISTLSLGSISVVPQSSDVTITNYDNLRTTMPELRKLINRVDNIEYNLAVLDLDREAIGNENPSNLSGVFSDGFVGLSKADVEYASNFDIDDTTGDAVSVDYDVALEVVDKEISLSFEETDTSLTINTALTTATLDLTNPSLIVLPKTSSDAVITQEGVTESITLNQYDAYDNDPKIRLTPYYENYMRSRDTLGERPPRLQETELKHRFITSWVRPRVNQDSSEQQIQGFNIRTGGISGISKRPSTDNITIESSDKILEEARPFIRDKEITVHGRGFLPNEPLIALTFDDVVIPFTAAAGFGTFDSATGNMTASNKGRFSATITLPSVERRPAHTIVCQGSLGAAATTTYRGWFWNRKPPEDVYHSEKKGFLPRLPVVNTKYSAVAQTFQLDTDTILSGVTIYLETIDADQPLIVQIRNVENNVPGTISYAEEVLSPRDGALDPRELLNTDTSVDGSVGKLINFTEPVFIRANQEYAITINSKGSGYKIWAARVGQVDLLTGQLISQQPFNVGQLFTSPSATEWLAQADADLKFKLHKSTFASSATVTFNTVTVDSADAFTRVILAAESSEMTGSKVSWYVNASGSSGSTGYIPITPFAVTELSTSATQTFTSITVKAEMTTEDLSQSPIIMKDSISILTRKLVSSGEYITKQTSLTAGNEFDEVRQTVKVKQGTGGTVTVYFGYENTENTTTWVTAVADPAILPVSLSDGYTRQHYRTSTPALPGPDQTSPAKLVGNVTPSVVNPVYDMSTFSGADTFDLSITYVDTLSATQTVAVAVPDTDFPGTSTDTPAQIVDAINAASALAITDALGVTTFEIATLDELNRIVLLHPQSYGHQRNKIEVTSICAEIGFGSLVTNYVDYGGSIVGSAVAAGVGEVSTGGANGLSATTDYYYNIIGTDGLGYTEIPDENDTIKVTTDGSNKTAKLEFDSGRTSIDSSSETIVIYRGTGSPGSLSWKRLVEIDAAAFGGVYYDDGSISGTSVTLPETTEVARKRLLDFRGRISLASSAEGNTPKVKEFTNVFVRA